MRIKVYENPGYFAQRAILLAIIINVFITSIDTATLDKVGCSLIKGNHTSIDIEENILKDLKVHGLYGKRFSYKDGIKYEYELVVCGDAREDQPNVSLTRLNPVQGSVEAIGFRNATNIAGTFGDWVMLSLGPGDNGSHSICVDTPLSSSIMIICDRKQSEGQFKLLYEDTEYCKFVFELRTSFLCGPAPGMSGWSILFIICLVGFIVYFIGGIFFMRFTKGAKGIDQIPHRTFWFLLGNKLADGCGAVCRCDQYCTDSVDRIDSNHHSGYSGGSYSGGYSPIGEGTPVTVPPHTMDRDTTLLNP